MGLIRREDPGFMSSGTGSGDHGCFNGFLSSKFGRVSEGKRWKAKDKLSLNYNQLEILHHALLLFKYGDDPTGPCPSKHRRDREGRLGGCDEKCCDESEDCNSVIEKVWAMLRDW